ncbi:hypothetical protein JoomaDRAFT_0249 [Galbibacter orientalis DSM 19592]|uniref:Uncharacterized protein n=1 Tax=Galbibacter orientalis DSM 19592 TaxID=926559 RepID=I3C113_9FLAO|nr:hypothetical protein JoomaDRAFT_0249 [Galbibacter orientalis DSM 19592]
MLSKFVWKREYSIVLIMNAIYIFVFYLIMISNK